MWRNLYNWSTGASHGMQRAVTAIRTAHWWVMCTCVILYNGECQWGKHWWMLLFRLFRRENFGEWPTMDIEYSWQCTAISAKFSNVFSHQHFLLYSIYIHTHIYIPCIYCMYFSMWLYVYITVYGWQLH